MTLTACKGIYYNELIKSLLIIKWMHHTFSSFLSFSFFFFYSSLTYIAPHSEENISAEKHMYMPSYKQNVRK